MTAKIITVETKAAAPIALVWDTYFSPEDIVIWNTASEDWHTTTATVDLTVGGEFTSRMEAKDGSMGFDFAGTYTRIVPHQLAEYSFGDRSATVSFTAQENDVVVSVAFEPEDQNSVEMQRNGWQAILDNFARHVASKVDK